MKQYHPFASNIVGHILFLLLLILLSTPHSTAALQLQTADTYKDQADIQGWYMSEKLDGIRGYWDGKRLWTQNGNPIHAPGWFTAALPSFELDGELWSSRGQFEYIASTVLDETPSPQWRSLTYNIFEVPHAPGEFQARLDKATAWLKAHPSDHVRIIVQEPCTGRDHLYEFLKQVRERNGEGVILKDPHRQYLDGSNQRVMKLKNYSRSKGIVMAHNPGKGQFKNMLGSLRVRLENGKEFNLGTGFSREQRTHPPAVGCTVRFKHCGLTGSGKPRFASFLGVEKED